MPRTSARDPLPKSVDSPHPARAFEDRLEHIDVASDGALRQNFLGFLQFDRRILPDRLSDVEENFGLAFLPENILDRHGDCYDLGHTAQHSFQSWLKIERSLPGIGEASLGCEKKEPIVSTEGGFCIP